MPVHDWTRVMAGTFHAFHNAWIAHLQEALNSGGLPEGYYALGEQRSGDIGSDVCFYLAKRRTLVIYHSTGDRIVALVEIVSPGNKHSRHAIDAFLTKAMSALDAGYHLMIIDVFPPARHDPDGMHGLIWEHLNDEVWRQPPGRPLSLAAYCAKTPVAAYVEPTAVGMALAPMPLFLAPTHDIQAPLEETYMSAWRGMPERWRRVVEPSI